MSGTPKGEHDLYSLPALLRRNAQVHADAPAYREKEFGIWQSWTWSETRDEIEALALGMLDLGLAPGDHVAIIGRNRPYLYWSMIAAEMCGAVPVPLYQDAVAEEMAYVLDHCGARFVVVGDQEQVDKVMVAFGYPVGPFAVNDMSGLEVSYDTRIRRAAADPNYRGLPITDRQVEKGRKGQKTGAGWYRYEPGDRTPHVDPEVHKIIKDVADEQGFGQREFEDTEVLHRLL